MLDVVQAVQLPRQLHHGKGRAQGGHLRPHQGLIGDGPAIAGRENRLEMVAHRLIPQHLLKLVAGLQGVGFLIVHADVKLFHLALAGMLDLIHGKIGVLFQGIEIRAVLRVPGHAARDADVQLAAAGQDGSAVLQGRAQLFQLFPHGVPAVVTVEQQHELIAREAGSEGARRGTGRQAAARLAEVLVAPVVAIGVVDGFQVVQVGHKQGGVAQRFRLGKQALAHPLECLTVVQARQDIVIALVLDAAALQRRHLLVFPAQLDDGACKLVQLPDARAGELRHADMVLLGPGQLIGELRHRFCQLACHHNTAPQAHHRGQKRRHDQQVADGMGEPIEVILGHGPDQQPRLAGERCVPAVKPQLLERRVLLLSIQPELPVHSIPVQRKGLGHLLVGILPREECGSDVDDVIPF